MTHGYIVSKIGNCSLRRKESRTSNDLLTSFWFTCLFYLCLKPFNILPLFILTDTPTNPFQETFPFDSRLRTPPCRTPSFLVSNKLPSISTSQYSFLDSPYFFLLTSTFYGLVRTGISRTIPPTENKFHVKLRYLFEI